MDDKSLVQDEGVNAGSDEQLHEPEQSAQAAPAGKVRPGGRPEEGTAQQPGPEDLTPAEQNPAEQTDEYPGQSSGSAGQDAGSID